MGGKSSKVVMKLLILGIAASGKSTFAKQMQLLHCGGFGDVERIGYVDIMRQNVLSGLQEMVLIAEKDDLSLKKELIRTARFFKELKILETKWDSRILEKCIALWGDDAIQQAWLQAQHRQVLTPQLNYLMDNLDRIGGEQYRPTDEDILIARQRTTGIKRTELRPEKKKSTGWELIDVGGQFSERAKWDKILDEDLSGMVYFAALDEFNIQSTERPEITKFQLSLLIFSELLRIQKAAEICLILFLNKKDVFEQKITDPTHFKEFKEKFPDYKGKQDYKEACRYIESLFRKMAQPRAVHIFVTHALDTTAMKTVFKAVQANLIVARMKAQSIAM